MTVERVLIILILVFVLLVLLKAVGVDLSVG